MEMTPIASQEQSRSGTPTGAVTPSLSPLCSVPASPSASEQELQLRTRREIAVLGLQLGKMSIASWASKEDRFRNSPEKSAGEEDRAKKAEYQSKELRIQEWENCQKLKFEAKMRHAEVQADQMKARAKNSLTKRLSTLSHKVEGKQGREAEPGSPAGLSVQASGRRRQGLARFVAAASSSVENEPNSDGLSSAA
ncbi:hypothetical protein ZWY2020_052263 [Hordeum vulgare]|nr:hypothetical protein ZWY2020_052263 [Hordeum vulgare]